MNTKLNHIRDWNDLAKDTNWSATRLAKYCNISTSTLTRFFRKNMGKTPKAWLREQRLYGAAESIKAGNSVKETAYRYGYKYPNQFSREFFKYWGCRPTSYE
jgi:AraC-like DNA-binding protein